MFSPRPFINRLNLPYTCHIVQRCLAAQKLVAAESNNKASNQKPAATANKNEKLLKVAIVGVPNAGKSTFINNLLNHRICPTSSKVHTTRGVTKAIHVRNNAQLILFDTPGLVDTAEMRRHHLETAFVSSQRHSIQHANMMGIVHDVSNTWTRGELHSTVLRTLEAYPKVPSFLILNKIDTLKSKRVLLDLARMLTMNTLGGRLGHPAPNVEKPPRRGKTDTKAQDVVDAATQRKRAIGWPGFSDVFMISSVTGDGIPAVLKFLLAKSQPGAWEYTADEFTDLPPEEQIVQSVRARLLDFMPQEIPYQLRSEIEFFMRETPGGRIFASVLVNCPSERIEKLVCGIKDGKLRQITDCVTSDLIETFGVPISLTITTRTTKVST